MSKLLHWFQTCKLCHTTYTNIFTCISHTALESRFENCTQHYREGLSVLIKCPLLMMSFSDFSDLVASQKNILSAIKTATFKRWSTKGLILPEHQMCQVLHWARYCDGCKEVVSIRAIWDRISFVKFCKVL